LSFVISLSLRGLPRRASIVSDCEEHRESGTGVRSSNKGRGLALALAC